MIPYAEKIVADHIRDAPEVAALETRVVGTTPSSTDKPWVRYTQLDARAVDGARHEHLVEFYFQFDCYAGGQGGQPEANLLTRRVREAVVAMPEATHDDAVVTGAEIRSSARFPDGDFKPSRERFVMTAVVWIRND